MSEFLRVSDLSLRYGTQWALRDISFEMQQGTLLSIIGANGSGKTTLLGALCGLIPYESGEVSIEGKLVRSLRSSGSVGVVFSEPMLYAELTLRENFELFCSINSICFDSCATLVDQFSLKEFLNHTPLECSKGVQQKASLFRALSSKPKFLLLDEPFSFLDMAGVGICVELFRQHLDQGGNILLASHDHDILESFKRETLVLERGRRIEHVS